MTEHEHMVNELVEITLQSGKCVTPTENHMMVVRDINGEFRLKQASLIEPGDSFCSRTARSEIVDDPVLAVKRFS